MLVNMSQLTNLTHRTSHSTFSGEYTESLNCITLLSC